VVKLFFALRILLQGLFSWSYFVYFGILLIVLEGAQILFRYIPAAIFGFKNYSSQQQIFYWLCLLLFSIVHILVDIKIDQLIVFRHILRPSKIVSQRIFKHLLGLDLEWLLSRSSGGTASAIPKGISKMIELLMTLSWEFIPSLFQLVLSLIPLGLYTPVVVIPLLISITAYILLTLWSGKLTMSYREEMNKLEEKSNAWMVQMLQGLSDILYSGNPEYFSTHFCDIHDKIYAIDTKIVNILISYIGRARLYLAKFSELFILFLLFKEYEANRIALEIFLGNATVVLTLFSVVHRVSRIFDEVFKTSEAIVALAELLSAESKIIEGDNTDIPQGDIFVRHLNFGYTPDKMIFENLSLRIKKGEIAAFVGESGSGKSTLLKLLLRQYDLQGGQVLIGDASITEYKNRSLQYHYVYVPQKPYIFGQSVRENVLMGNLCSIESLGYDIKKICGILNIPNFESVQVDDLVWLALEKVGLKSLFENLDQEIGERGVALSGGQSQRLAMARALIKSWVMLAKGLIPTILLDEPTSALDVLSEEDVMEGINYLHLLGCTVIIIAHRLSTIQNADTIFVFSKGRLVEQGNDKELLEKKGMYYNMVNPKVHSEESY
jgi:ABC-type multidrug transport system fused ATPase/permease subunit